MDRVNVITITGEEAKSSLETALRNQMPKALQNLEAMLEEFNRKSYLLKEFITCREASEYVDGYWDPTTIRRYVNRYRKSGGEEGVPGIKDGRLIMVHREGLEEMWRERLKEGVNGEKSDLSSDHDD